MKHQTFFFTCSLLLLVLCEVFTQAHGDSVLRSAVVIDAGSTSSKLKVYQWSDTGSPDEIPQIKLVKKEKFKPGLSSFLDKKTELTEYLNNIVASAKAVVPSATHNETPVFVFATAGFRYFPAEESMRLMADVRSVLSISGFRFTESNAQVISGEEEAAYLWVTVNYLQGYFERQSPAEETSRDEKSFGVMEIGGGSMQIAFEPDVPLYGEEFHVTVAGQLYQIYTQSYFNFGTNGINSQVVEQLALASPQASTISNPCMLKGDDSTMTLTSDLGRQVTLSGSGSSKKCRRQLRKIVKPATGNECQLKPCAIGSVYQPQIPETMKFYGVGAFGFLMKLDEDNILHIGELEKVARESCSTTIAQMKARGENTDWASANCLLRTYVPTFLTLSYKFPRDTNNILATGTIHGHSVDWALGAMLLQLGQHPREKREDYSIKLKRR